MNKIEILEWRSVFVLLKVGRGRNTKFALFWTLASRTAQWNGLNLELLAVMTQNPRLQKLPEYIFNVEIVWPWT